MCEHIMSDVVAPKVHQNNHSYVSLPSDSLRENLAWWAVTRRTLKNHEIVKIGVARVWALAWATLNRRTSSNCIEVRGNIIIYIYIYI